MGLKNLRELGRYGDGSSGARGSAACNGLTRTKSAPSSLADQTARSVRSVRSPSPQLPEERTL
jgi:hypothetical protein